MDWIIYGLKHEYYKINIECLNSTFNLIKIIREGFDSVEHTMYSNILFNGLIDKFRANDIDQELKLTIIATVGNLIFYLGHTLENKSLETLLDIYKDK
jgi:hypothetical protein